MRSHKPAPSLVQIQVPQPDKYYMGNTIMHTSFIIQPKLAHSLLELESKSVTTTQTQERLEQQFKSICAKLDEISHDTGSVEYEKLVYELTIVNRKLLAL